MKKVTVVGLAAVATLAACAPPAATQFNGSSVNIRTVNTLPDTMRDAEIEAGRICGKVGKRAEFASSTYIHDLNISNLYLCI